MGNVLKMDFIFHSTKHEEFQMKSIFRTKIINIKSIEMFVNAMF